MEAGIVTQFKLIGLLVAAVSLIPLLFLLWPGADLSEPTEPLDDHPEH
ncbi:MAG: hypothetical protein OZ921_09040 [Sorangiineae bacterium]|nr:hypothetical protein [Polyangiaceae bacterium]MEB2322647.1 hypothetical protein [Sorangiineae bacterium]